MIFSIFNHIRLTFEWAAMCHETAECSLFYPSQDHITYLTGVTGNTGTPSGSSLVLAAHTAPSFYQARVSVSSMSNLDLSDTGSDRGHNVADDTPSTRARVSVSSMSNLDLSDTGSDDEGHNVADDTPSTRARVSVSSMSNLDLSDTGSDRGHNVANGTLSTRARTLPHSSTQHVHVTWPFQDSGEEGKLLTNKRPIHRVKDTQNSERNGYQYSMVTSKDLSLPSEDVSSGSFERHYHNSNGDFDNDENYLRRHFQKESEDMKILFARKKKFQTQSVIGGKFYSKHPDLDSDSGDRRGHELHGHVSKQRATTNVSKMTSEMPTYYFYVNPAKYMQSNEPFSEPAQPLTLHGEPAAIGPSDGRQSSRVSPRQYVGLQGYREDSRLLLQLDALFTPENNLLPMTEDPHQDVETDHDFLYYDDSGSEKSPGEASVGSHTDLPSSSTNVVQSVEMKLYHGAVDKGPSRLATERFGRLASGPGHSQPRLRLDSVTPENLVPEEESISPEPEVVPSPRPQFTNSPTTFTTKMTVSKTLDKTKISSIERRVKSYNSITSKGFDRKITVGVSPSATGLSTMSGEHTRGNDHLPGATQANISKAQPRSATRPGAALESIPNDDVSRSIFSDNLNAPAPNPPVSRINNTESHNFMYKMQPQFQAREKRKGKDRKKVKFRIPDTSANVTPSTTLATTANTAVSRSHEDSVYLTQTVKPQMSGATFSSRLSDGKNITHAGHFSTGFNTETRAFVQESKPVSETFNRALNLLHPKFVQQKPTSILSQPLRNITTTHAPPKTFDDVTAYPKAQLKLLPTRRKSSGNRDEGTSVWMDSKTLAPDQPSSWQATKREYPSPVTDNLPRPVADASHNSDPFTSLLDRKIDYKQADIENNGTKILGNNGTKILGNSGTKVLGHETLLSDVNRSVNQDAGLSISLVQQEDPMENKNESIVVTGQPSEELSSHQHLIWTVSTSAPTNQASRPIRVNSVTTDLLLSADQDSLRHSELHRTRTSTSKTVKFRLGTITLPVSAAFTGLESTLGTRKSDVTHHQDTSDGVESGSSPVAERTDNTGNDGSGDVTIVTDELTFPGTRLDNESYSSQQDSVRLDNESHSSQQDSVRLDNESHSSQQDSVRLDNESHSSQQDSVRLDNESHSSQQDSVRLDNESYSSQQDSVRLDNESHSSQQDGFLHLDLSTAPNSAAWNDNLESSTINWLTGSKTTNGGDVLEDNRVDNRTLPERVSPTVDTQNISHSNFKNDRQVVDEVPPITVYRSLESFNRTRSSVTSVSEKPPSTTSRTEIAWRVGSTTTTTTTTDSVVTLSGLADKRFHPSFNANEDVSFDSLLQNIQSISDKIKNTFENKFKHTENRKSSELDLELVTQPEPADFLSLKPVGNGPMLSQSKVNRHYFNRSVTEPSTHRTTHDTNLPKSSDPNFLTDFHVVASAIPNMDAKRPGLSAVLPGAHIATTEVEGVDVITTIGQFTSCEGASARDGQPCNTANVDNRTLKHNDTLNTKSIAVHKNVSDTSTNSLQDGLFMKPLNHTINFIPKTSQLNQAHLEDNTTINKSENVPNTTLDKGKSEKNVKATIFNSNFSTTHGSDNISIIKEAMAKLVNLTQNSALFDDHPDVRNDRIEDQRDLTSPNQTQAEINVFHTNSAIIVQSQSNISHDNKINFTDVQSVTATNDSVKAQSVFRNTTREVIMATISSTNDDEEKQNISKLERLSNESEVANVSQGTLEPNQFLTSATDTAARLKQSAQTLDYALFGMDEDGHYVGEAGVSTGSQADYTGRHINAMTKRMSNPQLLPDDQLLSKSFGLAVTLPEDGFILHTQSLKERKQGTNILFTKSSTRKRDGSESQGGNFPETKDHAGHSLPALHIPSTALYIPGSSDPESTARTQVDPESRTNTETVSSVPVPVERYGSPQASLTDVGLVLTRHWPAVLGVTTGTVFLLTALITSILCRQRR